MAKSAAQVKTIPAPIGGLNTKDGYASMPPTDAIALVNWLPDTGGLRCRKGYSEWVTNITGDAPVYSIIPYFNQSDTFPAGSFLTAPTSMPGELFAATDDDIFDVTSTTDAPASVKALSGAAGAGKLISSMLVNSAGTTFLLVTSEADGYITYDGTTWLSVTAGAGATQINGADPTKFAHVLVWKRRALFTERNSTKMWIAAVDSPYGTVTKFDFGAVFPHGGHLLFLAKWTIDAGEGVDDLLVAVSSNGDVAVYKGSDPTSPADFGLVGTWFVGQMPVGRRACVQYGGDLILISAEGVFPISYITRGGAEMLIASASEYSSYIRSIIGVDLRASFTEFGWSAVVHPSERILLINVPDYGSIQSRQYALTTTNNRWAVLANIPALSLGSIGGYTFAGTRDGRVLLLFNGVFDNVAYGESTGDSIPGLIVPAFNYFEVPAVEKQFLLIRPVFIYTGRPQVVCDIAVNFVVTDPVGSAISTAPSSALWDSALWDSAVWGGEQLVYDEWHSAGDTGFCGTAVIRVDSTGDTVLSAIDYTLQFGGVAG